MEDTHQSFTEGPKLHRIRQEFHIVDDADPSIAYVGQWKAYQWSHAFNSTMHGAKTAGAAVDYEFSGSSISVVGPVGVTDIYGTPVSTYTVDNSPTVTFVAPQVTGSDPLNNVIFFSMNNLTPEGHTLSIRRASTDDATYFLDFIQVTLSELPAPSSSMPAATSLYTPPDTTTEESSHHSPSFSPPPSSSAPMSEVGSNQTYVPSPGGTMASSATTSPPEHSSKRTSGTDGIIIGVVCGIISLLVMATAIIVQIVRRRKRSLQHDSRLTLQADDIDGPTTNEPFTPLRFSTTIFRKSSPRMRSASDRRATGSTLDTRVPSSMPQAFRPSNGIAIFEDCLGAQIRDTDGGIRLTGGPLISMAHAEPDVLPPPYSSTLGS